MVFPDEITDQHGMALWHRYSNLSPERKRDLTSVSSFTRDRGLVDASVSLRKAGRFRAFDCVAVMTGVTSILLPCDPAERLLEAWGHKPLLGADDFFEKVEWFYPAYMMQRFVAAVQQLVESENKEWRVAFEAALALAYTPEYIATMLIDRYRAIPQIAGRVHLIKESVEAFYFALTSVAIASLLPVIEGVLSEMLLGLANRQDQTGVELLRQVTSAAIESAARGVIYYDAWIPPEYRERHFLVVADEYVEMLEVFERFGSRFFFAKTEDYKGTGLNRPGIVHSVITDYGSPSNFYRLLSILDFLAFVGSMNTSGVSLLAPNDTPTSLMVARRLKGLALLGVASRLLSEQEKGAG